MAAGTVLVAAFVPGSAATAAPPTPAFFQPNTSFATTAYSLRFAGTDRYSTAGTLGQFSGVNGTSGTDSFPFDSPDFAVPGSAWGNDDCPGMIGLSAGDTPADALAASSMWEIGTVTSGSVVNGPTPPSVHTYDAVMLLTNSARDGATDLNTEAVRALQAIKTGPACGGTLHEGVIFGGSGAIPAGAINTFKTFFGAHSIIQIAGTNRFDTARQIALTVNGTTGLKNVGYYPDATPAHAVQLHNAVILAEGFTGADALAVAPFAAHHHIPVLLTGSTALPSETSTALAALSPSNIIVLGGTNAIAASVASAAAAAAGSATVTRIAGADRYESSVDIAEQLMDLWPADQAAGATALGACSGVGGTVGAGTCYSGAQFGIARSEGAGATSVGWPDALSEAWPMSTNSNECNTIDRPAPSIIGNDSLDPVSQARLRTTCVHLDNNTPPAAGTNFADTPLLLTTQTSLPTSVSTFLTGLYSSANSVVAQTPATHATATANNYGGFAFLFGGTGAVGSGVESAVTSALSGGTYTSAVQGDLAPTMDATKVFWTRLGLTTDPSSEGATEAGGADNTNTAPAPQVCSYRNALVNTEYLGAYNPSTFSIASSTATDYQQGTIFTKNQSRFQCVDVSGLDNGASAPTAAVPDMATVFGMSLSGHATAPATFDWSAASKTLTNGAGLTNGSAGSVTGNVAADVAPGTPHSVTYTYLNQALPVTFKGTAYGTTTANITLTLTRTDNNTADGTDAVTASGTLTVFNGSATLFTATLTGEAAGSPTAGAQTLHLDGFYTEGTAMGGFKSDIGITAAPGAAGDGALTGFSIDGLA